MRILMSAALLFLASSAAAQTSQTYVYDVHGRAVAATRAQPGGTSSFATYNYDSADSRTARTAQTFSPPASSYQLQTNEQMTLQQSLTSADGRFKFNVQSDGNLAVWFGPSLLWHLGSYGTSADMLAMQGDGNLVLYGPNYSVIWHAGTYGHAGARLVMQDDGNLVIYDGWTPIWSTGTGGH